MDLQIIIGMLMTLAPVLELRGGLPVVIEYCVKKGISFWPYLIVVLILNVLVIFFIFFFLDFLHEAFMKNKIYNRFMTRKLEKIRKKSAKIQNKMDNLGYLALMFFVAIPFPGTGAWTGTLVAWTLGLNRSKSFVAISLGVVVAGFLVLFASLGIFHSIL